MSGEPGPWFARPVVRTAAVLAVLAYLPALTAAPGRMPADSKLYLYLDPGRFFGDAASTFDARQFAGWVPHQHVAYLWPTNPWFWSFETLGAPDWIAHRLWIGTIMLVAGLGVRWCARLLGLGPMAAFVAAVVYQLSLYVLPYVSRTSVMLLPWAALGWIVAFTIRATRRQTWGDPAAIALIVLTVGAVNATALAMIVPAPVLWLVHAAWAKAISWPRAALVAARTAALSIGTSLWWITMLFIQGRYGTDVLPYSESLADVSLTATAPETWRALGYWLFYVRDPFAATTTESLRYLSSTPSIAISYVIPLLAVAALTWIRWAHRRFAAALIATGLILAVGVHPIDDRSPLMNLVAGGDDSGLALALRSSTRALPVTMLGVALAIAMAIDAMRSWSPSRPQLGATWLPGGLIVLVAVVNLPSLWTGAFVDPALERDQDPPAAWVEASDALDRVGRDGRVLQLPGAEFGAYRWGYTVDQPLPGLTDKPLVTRDLLPLGSPGAMDLAFALDDRTQDGVLEPDSLAPVARLLGVDTIWVTNDAAFERFRTTRPEVVRDLVDQADGIGPLEPFGQPVVNTPTVPMTDERSIGDLRVATPAAPVEIASVSRAGRVVRVATRTMLVSGSGDGLVDLAAAGLLDGDGTAVRYSADTGTRTEIDSAGLAAEGTLVGVAVTDSNRDRARHWRSSQDTTGFTESGGDAPDVLRPVASDARLDVFDTDDPDTQTVARQDGPVRATATAYGEPFAYLPEQRAAMAIDGDPTTAWLVGGHGDPIGEMIRLEFDQPIDSLTLRQPDRPGDRRITSISVSIDGDPPTAVSLAEGAARADGGGHTVDLDRPALTVELQITEVGGGTPFTASAVAPVGFTEIESALGPSLEVVRHPIDGLDAATDGVPLAYVFTRLRTDPMDRWRSDPEPKLIRDIVTPDERSFDLELVARIDPRADDADLAELFGWPVVASSRLTGSPRHAGVAAFDDDPETSWITGFDAALGATLTTVSSEPITTLEVSQLDRSLSHITELTLRSGGDERQVRLDGAAPGAPVVIDPPIAAGEVEFRISAIDAATTVDRRFGDLVTLPAAIDEIRFEGRTVTPSIASSRAELPCTPVATVDDVSVTAVISVRDDGWLDGAPIVVEPCEPTIRLAAGEHRLVAEVVGRPVTVDRVVVDDGLLTAVRETTSRSTVDPTVERVSQGAFDRSVRVHGCSAGCWLVVGEGFNEAWAASGPTGDLGPPTLVDGGFNGWWLPPSDSPQVIEVRWTAQRALNWAFAATVLVALAAITVIVHDRRTRVLVDAGVESTLPSRPRPIEVAPHRATRRSVGVTACTWVALAALVISPGWAWWAALAGVAMLTLRRPRVVELTALASLLVVASGVVIRERRAQPLPDGGWPGTFDSWHGLAMFAIVAVLVAALVADDAVDRNADTTADLPDTATDP